ncbi:unnamed protein product, partial [Gadus morhua 'NCC']
MRKSCGVYEIKTTQAAELCLSTRPAEWRVVLGSLATSTLDPVIPEDDVVRSRIMDTWNDGHVTLAHPLQEDTTSCGVFGLKFAEHILEGSSSIHFPTSNLDDLRREIATTNMTGS